MTAANQIFPVMDASSPKAALTTASLAEAQAGTLNRPLVYRIDGEGHSPVIMTLARAMGE
jgi:hypothetical protein